MLAYKLLAALLSSFFISIFIKKMSVAQYSSCKDQYLYIYIEIYISQY